MRRVGLSHVCGLSLVLTLAGCGELEPLLPWIIEREPPSEPSEPAAAVTIEHASTFLPIEAGRLLRATTQGFHILDLRDPRHPRVEGSFAIASEKLELYRMGDHVLLLATYPRGYAGERTDVPVRREPVDHPALLLNIDISDRTQPTLVNELTMDDLPRHTLMRRAPEGSALFVVPTIWNGERYLSRVDRYELREGVLQNTAQLALDGTAEAVAGTPDRLLAATVGVDAQDESASAIVLDITQPALSVAYSASYRGEVGRATQLRLSADQLRVLYSEPTTHATSIATFSLGSQPRAAPSICSVSPTAAHDLDASLFSASARELFISDAAGSARLAFDATGACPERSSFGADSRSYALHTLERGRLLALGSGEARLYDTTAKAEPLLLARAPVSAQPAVSAQAALQVLRLTQHAAASDGTTEPLLAGVISVKPEHDGRYELLTVSDTTLTARGTVELRGYPENLALFGRTLVGASATQLHTFDARDLNAPIPLAQLALAEHYGPVFARDAHVARIRRHPAVLPPGERNLAVRDDLEVLGRNASGDWELTASLPVEAEGEWLQLGALLVNAQLTIAQYGTESERKAKVAIQVYDLSDPGAPRKAGALSTTEIEAEWTTGHFYEPSLSYHVAGDALVIPQRKRVKNVHVKQCWKTIDHDACRGSSDPDCEPDSYTGTLFCRALDAGPEECTLHGLTHCSAERCEPLDQLPAGIAVIEDGCTEFEELGRTTTFAFNVIDLRDPDRPALIRPLFALPDDRFLSHRYFVRGSKIYATELDGDVLFASELELRDPEAPQLTPRYPVTGAVVAATEQDVYIGPADYDGSSFTLARVRCCGEPSQPSATRAWTGRMFGSLRPDGSGHLLLMHSRAAGSEPAPDVQSSWARLEMLDAQTLATLGALDIDSQANIVSEPAHGRLLVAGPGVLYVIDVRDPRQPRMQAAVPHHTGHVALTREQLIVADALGFRSYPSTLQNMSP